MATVRVAQILSQLIAGATGSADLPTRLVEECVRSIPVTGAAIVLMNDSGPAGMVAATDGPATVMEELQFTTGEGPCVDASRTGRPVLVADLAATGHSRWPGFSAGVAATGAAAVFALPLRVGVIRVGVLDLYRDVPGPLTRGELSEALAFADAATTVLLHLQATGSDDDHSLVAVPVAHDRAEVHQATGVVAVQSGVPLPHALLLLRARAFAADVHILDLARDVLNGTVKFPREEGALE